MATGVFDTMDIGVDEDEHSIEMHLPYIAKVMERCLNDFALLLVCHYTITKRTVEIFSISLNQRKC